jgi:hypothetical protein
LIHHHVLERLFISLTALALLLALLAQPKFWLSVVEAQVQMAAAAAAVVEQVDTTTIILHFCLQEP